MRDFIYTLGYMLMALTRAFIWVLRPVGGAIVWPIRTMAKRAKQSASKTPKPAPVREASKDETQQQVRSLKQEAQPLQAADFTVADRIISIRLDPPVGVLNLRVYKATKTVKRDLIINEPRLRAIMKGRRFTFADAAFDPKEDMEEVKEETVRLAEELINRVGNARVKGVKPTKEQRKAEISQKASEPDAKVVAKANTKQKAKTAEVDQAQVAPARVAAKAEPASAARATQVATEKKVFTPSPTVGITYVGTLLQAGSHRVTPRDRDAYEVFQAVILLDNGAELPLRGAELERELEAAGCEVGKRVSITPMGKVPVTLASGGQGSKNLYKVENLKVN